MTVSQRGRTGTWLLGLGLVATTFALYVYTLAPSLVWADGARLQLDAALGGSTYWFLAETRGISSDGGPFDHLGAAAWDHPLYVLLARLALAVPWGEPPARQNLLSALAAVATLALLYRAGCRLTGDPRAAALAALALAVSHTFWFHAVTAEVYTLHTLFMMALIVPALRGWAGPRDLELTGLAAGLGLANHVMLGLTLLPVAARFAACRPGLRRGQVLAAFGLFVLGWSPFWIQWLRMSRVVGAWSALQMAAGHPALGQRLATAWGPALLVDLGKYAGWLVYQFTPVGLAVGILGFAVSRRRRVPLAFLGALIALHVAFSANYDVPDRFTFHLPSYLLFALLMSVGFARLLETFDRWAAGRRPLWPATVVALAGTVLLSPVALYAWAPRMLRSAGWDESRTGIPPVGAGARDGLTYFLDPNRRGDTTAARFGRSTLAGLAPRALVLTPVASDQETFVVLRYFQLVEGLRPDVDLDLMLSMPPDGMRDGIWQRVAAQAGCRPLYLASLDPAVYPLPQLRQFFQVRVEANLYRVVPAEPPSSDCERVEPARLALADLIVTAMRAR